MIKIPFQLKISAKDFSVRVFAVLIAIGIWFVVSVMLFPLTSTHISDIPVEIVLTNTQAEAYELEPIGDVDYTVTAQVRGNRSEIGNLTKDDLLATLSLDGVNTPDTYRLRVEVNPVNSNVEFEVVSITPAVIEVQFDRIITKEFTVEAEVEGATPAEGFLLEEPTVSPSEVLISGPETDIAAISSCIVEASMDEELTQSLKTTGELVLYDSEGRRIEKDTIEIENDNFDINLDVYMRRTLELGIRIQNQPSNFDIDSLEYEITPTTIEIASPTDAEGEEDAYNIGYIDLRDVDVGYEREFPINLPSGYRNISGIETATVRFSNENMGNQSFNVSEFTIVNQSSAYDVRMITERINNVVLVGPTSVIANLTADDIVAEIDMIDWAYGVGAHTVPVEILVPTRSNVWVYGSYNASIDVTEASD